MKMTQNLEEYLKNNTLKIGDSCINNMGISVMLKQSLILGAKAEKEQQTKVRLTKLGGVTSLRNGMVAIAYNVLRLSGRFNAA